MSKHAKTSDKKKKQSVSTKDVKSKVTTKQSTELVRKIPSSSMG